MSLIQGKCFYSGFDIPVGKGKYHITNDGKQFLARSQKVWRYSQWKIKPQKIKYTVASRVFNKKGEAETREKKTKIVVEKSSEKGFMALSKDDMAELLKKSLATKK